MLAHTQDSELTPADRDTENRLENAVDVVEGVPIVVGTPDRTGGVMFGTATNSETGLTGVVTVDERPKLILPPSPEEADPNTASGWPFEEFRKVFEGNLKLLVSKLPKTGLMPVYESKLKPNPDGTTSRAFLTRMARRSNTPEGNYELATRFVSDALNRQRDQFLKSDEEENKSELAQRVKYLYALRYDLDTAYQDYKVSEIEERARKLREEVTRRQGAGKKWVAAMMTLDEMKADGIDVKGTGDEYANPSSVGPGSAAGVAPRASGGQPRPWINPPGGFSLPSAKR